MPIALRDEERARALESIKQYARDELELDLGELRAGTLLDYVLTELAPLAYNRGVRDAQARMQATVGDLDGDCHEPPFGWRPA